MFSLPPYTQVVHLYAKPINMGWGEKKLSQICREEVGIELDAGVFLFHNRAKDQLRLF